MDETYDLDSYPAEISATVHVEGREISVKPFRGKQFAAAMRLSRPVFRYFGALQDTGEIAIDWPYLIGAHFDALAELCDLQLGWEPGTAGGGRLAPDQMVDLLRAMLEVNLDFFSRRFQPSLGRLTRDLKSFTSGSAKPGSGSSPAATAKRPSWLTRWLRSIGGSIG